MTETGTPTVVALGQVDPALVTPHLPEGTTFVAEPTADDLPLLSDLTDGPLLFASC